MAITNLEGNLFVNKIDIITAVNSSIIQIGSNESITLENRVKNIRHIAGPESLQK